MCVTEKKANRELGMEARDMHVALNINFDKKHTLYIVYIKYNHTV